MNIRMKGLERLTLDEMEQQFVDSVGWAARMGLGSFQSTPPARGATETLVMLVKAP